MEELKQQEILDQKNEIRHKIDLSNSDILKYQECLISKNFKPHEIENHQFKSDDDSDSDYEKEYAESFMKGTNYQKSCIQKRRCLIAEMNRKSDEELFKPENFKFDSPATVFSLIRHLIAIRKELGCIVNGITKLYIITAAMEKEKSFSSEILLYDIENFIAFKLISLKLQSAIERKNFEVWKMRGAQRVLQQLNAMLVQVAYRNKELDNEYKKFLDFINFPYIMNKEEIENENIEVAKIVTQFLCEQENNFDDETIEIIVETIRHELYD